MILMPLMQAASLRIYGHLFSAPASAFLPAFAEKNFMKGSWAPAPSIISVRMPLNKEKIMDRTATLASAVYLACAVAGCETTPDATSGATVDLRRGEEVGRICFNRTIDGFSNTERGSVVLSAGPGRDYYVEVSGACLQLRHAQTIGIDATLSCVTRGDILIVSDSISSGGPQPPDRCLISAIYEWRKDAGSSEGDQPE